MKKLFSFITLCLAFCKSEASMLVVKDICELSSDITARTKVQYDTNGEECALVRVNIPSIRDIEFEKEKIISEEYLPGEYVLYVPPRTESISFIFGGSYGIIDFKSFGVELRGKYAYRCILQKVNSNQDTRNNGKLRVLSTPVPAIILIDGIPKGETPLLIDDIDSGEHTLSVPNSNGFTIPDKKIVIEGGKELTMNLELTEEPVEPFNIEIVWHGGDSSSETWSIYKIFEKNGKKGIIDILGNTIVPCQFDNVFPELQNGFFVVWNEKKCGLYSPAEGLAIPTVYSSISTYASEKHKERFLRVSKGTFSTEKFGYIDCLTKTEVVPCIYERASDFAKENYLIVATSYNKYGYLKIEGNTIKQFIAPRFDEVSEFENGVALVRQKKGAGYVESILNSKGQLRELPQYYTHRYDNNIGFSEGLCSVRKNGKTGFINKDGVETIPCLFNNSDVFEHFHNGGAVLWNDNGRFLISNNGKIVGNNDNIDFSIGSTNYYVYKKNGKEGVISRNGTIIIPCEYEKCKVLRDGWVGKYSDIFSAYKKDKCYLYDNKGKMLFSCPANLNIIGFKDGFIMIKDLDAGTYGYANLNGEIIANCIYELSRDLSMMMNSTLATIGDGLAMLIIGNRYGFINNKGEVVVPLNYNGAIPFRDGVGYVRNSNGKWIKLTRNI